LYRLLRERPELRNNSAFLNSFYTYESNSKLGKLIDIETAMSVEDWDEVEILLNEFTPATYTEEVYWQYYYLYTKAHTNGWALETEDSSSLAFFAQECAETHGRIVYSLRALYKALYPNTETIYDNCPPNAGRSKVAMSVPTKEIVVVQPAIFPIISQGEVYVTVPQAAGNQQLHIMDNQGKVYFSHIFEANATLTPLSLSLAPGVYFAHFQSLTSNETFTQKIVIH
jgi:hypothetical protein